jgi:flagellar biosynthetic protein FliR
MTFFVAEIVEMLQTFIWPFVRITALMITAPIFSQRALNLRVRIVTGFVLTWMIYPFIDIPQVDPFSIGAIYGLFNEITVGALMGFTLQIVSAAIVVSGHAVSSSMGLGMANMMDPNLGNVPTLSQFLLIIGLLVFLSLGGHLVSISILVQSFIAIPVGSGLLSTEAISGFHRLFLSSVYRRHHHGAAHHVRSAHDQWLFGGYFPRIPLASTCLPWAFRR